MSEIKMFTYNLRTDTAKHDGKNVFSIRKEFVLKTFPRYNADLIGFQEITPTMREWLLENFTDYTLCGMGRGAELDDESNVILFKKDRFDLMSFDYFWLSDTPYKPGSRFSTDQSGCPRICSCAMLYDRESKKLFRHYNTHLDHVGAFAQAQGVSLILNRISSDYDRWQVPVILTGDFNVTPDSTVVKSVLHFDGCGKKLVDVTAGVGGTFHDYKNPDTDFKIDYIFTNLECDASRSFKATDCEDGVYLSDHYPVCAYLEI